LGYTFEIISESTILTNMDEFVDLPIEDVIDLHSFKPGEIKDLLQDYLEAAYDKGFEEVRIIHGKGIGSLRLTVQSILKKHPFVLSFRQADEGGGSWGATIAVLRKKKA
jgi:dsDNA-specific endonuclease/ATPase MutS2